MRPVLQTRFGGPGDMSPGNCFAASFASIFELPLTYVERHAPKAGGDGDNPVDDDWIAGWARWLGTMNLRWLCLQYDHSDRDFYSGYAILGIESPGLRRWPNGAPGSHAVVWKDGVIVWDPSPAQIHERGGIAIVKPETITLFTVLDPTKPIGIHPGAKE